ncbi:MAG: outer membrane protein assembly factor BamA [Cyclobacteriaceae bacterium]
MNKRLLILLLSIFFLAISPSLLGQSIADLAPVDLDTIENKLVVINNIYILGNVKTKKSIITRELSFNQGDTIRMHKLIGYRTEDRNKIYNTNLFNTVDLQILEIDTDHVEILITLTERWYLYPGVIFRTSAGDRNFTNWWRNEDHDLSRVNYGLRLSKFNLRGRDETLLLTAQFGFEKVLLLNYVIPYLDKNQKFGLIADIGYSEFKNIPYRTLDHTLRFILSEDIQRRSFGTGLSLSYRRSFYTRHYLSAGFRTSKISNNLATANPEYYSGGATSQSYLRLSYTYSRDYRDNNTYPLRGNLISATLGKSGLGVFNDFNRWYLLANYYQYLDLGKGFFLGTNIGANVSTKNVPYSRYLGLGYDNYLVRGYELNVIEGYQMALFKSSLKKRIFRTSATIPEEFMPIKQFQRWPMALYAKTFFDAAYVQNYPNYKENQRLSNKPIYSAGLGLDFVTIHDITIRLEQSYNAEGKFNFVLGFQQDL